MNITICIKEKLGNFLGGYSFRYKSFSYCYYLVKTKQSQCNSGGLGLRPISVATYAEVAQLVESLPSKQAVAGSNPVFRSILKITLEIYSKYKLVKIKAFLFYKVVRIHNISSFYICGVGEVVNTYAFHAYIHGFKSRTPYQLIIKIVYHID